MNKTFAFAFAAATIVGLASAVPAQAATRSTDLSPNVFAKRCIEVGGHIYDGNPTFTCHTLQIAVECEFLSQHRARCAWPGAENLASVNRLIGHQTPLGVGGSSSHGFGGGNGGGNGGGGIDLPDLPIDNGGGGGGIDLPDLPLNNG